MNQFREWAKYHGPEKQEYLANVFWQNLKLYDDPSFTPDILSTIKAKWLVVQGDNDFALPLQQALEMHQYKNQHTQHPMSSQRFLQLRPDGDREWLHTCYSSCVLVF